MTVMRQAMQAASLGLVLFCTAIAARTEPQGQNGPSSVVPAPLPLPPPPLPPQSLTPPPAPNATSPRPRDAIGTAEMQSNGAIRLHLWPPAEPVSGESFGPAVPWASPQERIGYGEIEIERADGVYAHVLQHVGGLRPGEVKSVPPWRADEPWHCIVDPDRGPCPLEHLLQ